LPFKLALLESQLLVGSDSGTGGLDFHRDEQHPETPESDAKSKQPTLPRQHHARWRARVNCHRWCFLYHDINLVARAAVSKPTERLLVLPLLQAILVL
jgi:hypothetical protein